MNGQTALQKTSHFFLTKIIIGIAVVVASVAFTEWSGRLLLDKTQLTDDSNVIIAISDAAITLLSYILLFRVYEKRRIKEVGLSAFGKNAITGFATGIVLQSLFIFVIYIAGNYSVIHINPVSFLLPSFATAFTAGFVAEILIRGIFFRLTEEKLGTVITLIISAVMFALLHAGKNQPFCRFVLLPYRRASCFLLLIFLTAVCGFLYFYILPGTLLSPGFLVRSTGQYN